MKGPRRGERANKAEKEKRREKREKQHLTSGLRRGKKTAIGPWSVPESSSTLARLFGPTCPSAYLLLASLSPRPSRSSSIPRTHPVPLPLSRRDCPFSGGPLPTWQPPPNRPRRIIHLAPSLVRSVSRGAGEAGRKRDILSLLARSLQPSLRATLSRTTDRTPDWTQVIRRRAQG